MSERSPFVPAALLLSALTGCKDGDSTPTPIVPAACMQEWQDEGYLVNEGDTKISPAPVEQIAPELATALNDTERLAGFLASFQVSEGQYAVSPDSLQNRVSSGELVSLVFEGELPSVDTDKIWQGTLDAPTVDATSIPGQLDGYFDVSGGAANDLDSDWEYEETFGAGETNFGVMFLDRDCTRAAQSLDGKIATYYKVSPESITQSN